MNKHLFIVTYGRTGSTLLLGILNRHPGIDISGENEGFVYALYRSLATLETYQSQRIEPEKDTSSHPFYGVSSFPFAETREQVSRIFEGLFPPREGIVTRGFKDIRYDMPDLENYLDFLTARFPHTQFVFLTRDHAAVKRSGFYRTTDAALLENYLTVLDGRFHEYVRNHPDTSFHLRYEELMDFNKIRGFFDFIGHQADETAWREAVAEKHSFSQRSVQVLVPGSHLVLFDSAKRLLEVSNFEVKNHEMKNIKKLALTGILMPREETGTLDSLCFRNKTTRYEARVGINSPMYAERFPHNPLSSNARFSFIPQPIQITNGMEDFELVATFANTGTEVIGRLFVSPNQGILPESA